MTVATGHAVQSFEYLIIQTLLQIFGLKQGCSQLDNLGGGGGLVFIYLCSQTIKTIDFKRN